MNSGFATIESLLARQFEKPRMLIDPIIPWGGTFVIHGPRAAGKSQLALEIASCVARGAMLFGTWACERARVLLIEVDMTASILQERMGKLNGHFPTGIQLAVLTADGSLNAVDPHPSDIPAIQDAKRYNPELVIIDSLRKTHILDENESKTPEIVYQAWRRFFPAATIGYLHHDRKVVMGPMAGDVDEAFRGTTAWLDNVDTGMHLVRDKKVRDEHRCLLTFSKVRTCEQPAPLMLRLHPDTLAIEPAKGALTARLALLAHLEQVPADRYIRGAVEWLLKKKLCSKATAYRIVEELQLPEASVQWRVEHGLAPVAKH